MFFFFITLIFTDIGYVVYKSSSIDKNIDSKDIFIIKNFLKNNKNKLSVDNVIVFIEQFINGMKIIKSYKNNSLIILFPTQNKNIKGKMEIFFIDGYFAHYKISYLNINFGKIKINNSENIYLPSIDFVKEINLIPKFQDDK